MCDMDDTGYASGWDVMIEARRVQHRFEVAMDQALEAYGISYAQYRALEMLVASREMHIAELARKLRVTRQAATASVEKLARTDLVDLHREAHVTFVTVSTHGRRTLAKLREFADLHQQLEQQLTPTERFRLVLLLRKADHALVPPRRPAWWLED